MPAIKVVVPVMTMMMPMMARLMAVAEFAMPAVVLKAAIAVTMVVALRLRGGHREAQCGNQCQCKQFFEHFESPRFGGGANAVT
ncbi:MAG: hypothetical protein ABIS45_17910 [Burkholderiales bacterium]